MNQIKKEIERYLYKEVAKELNQAFELDKTAQLSTGLFLKLPLEIEFKQSNHVVEKKLSTIFSAYTEVENDTSIYFTFFYKDKKSLNAIYKTIQKYNQFWAYAYLHEMLHITFKHITIAFSKRMHNIVNKEKPNLDKYTAHSIINTAEDYFINYCIKDIADNKVGATELLEFGLYNKDFHKQKLSDIEILKILLNNDCKSESESLNNGFSLETFTDSKGNKTITITKDDTPISNNISNSYESDNQLSDLAEAINETIKSQARSSTGSQLINKIFSSIKVETDWFKRIKTKFKRDVFYMTRDFYTKWSSLNNKYRKIFKSPKKYYLDNKIEIILVVDQSGSVSTEELQKLLYLIEENSKIIDILTVLIHDVDLVKTYKLCNTNDITNDKQFKEALATRTVVGGTSHAWMPKWLKDNKIDKTKSIVIVWSDMYSDIEQTCSKMRYYQTYWCETQGAVLSPSFPGTHIYLT